MPVPIIGRFSNRASSDFADVSSDRHRRVLGLLSAVVLAFWILSAATSPWIFLPATLILAALSVRGLLAWVRRADEREEQLRRDLNVQLEKQVRLGRRIAIRDGMSTLLHRWYFELRVAEETSRCQRYGSSMAILYAKTKPGPRGRGITPQDREVEVAQTFSKNLRLVDLATKVGEWEYAVCLPQTDEAGARAVASRVMTGSGLFSFVVGLALCPRDGADFDALLTKARASLEAGELDLTEEPYVPPAVIDEDETPAPAIEAKVQRPTRAMDLVHVLANETSGGLPIEGGSSARSLKATLRRASRKAGVELKIWESDGVIFFERVDIRAPASDVA